MSGRSRRGVAGVDVHLAVAARLEVIGQRYTAVRRGIIDALLHGSGPRPVTELVGGDAPVPLSSAYRNLADLVQAGAVVRVAGTDDVARFELAEDLTGHHHHILCTGCGLVVDVELPGTVERAMAAAVAEVGEATGFHTTGHRLDLIGLCRTCS